MTDTDELAGKLLAGMGDEHQFGFLARRCCGSMNIICDEVDDHTGECLHTYPECCNNPVMNFEEISPADIAAFLTERTRMKVALPALKEALAEWKAAAQDGSIQSNPAFESDDMEWLLGKTDAALALLEDREWIGRKIFPSGQRTSS
jgi:hypothetical protein